MNRKQKKEKQLRARAHTKKQATVYLTPDEEQKLYGLKAHSDWDEELLEVERESRSFINKIKTALRFIFIVVMILIVHHVGARIWT